MATIEWINHASYVLSDGKVTLITDPWLEGSAFNNAWALLAPSAFPYERFAEVTHIWVSHEHPDHFAPPVLKRIPPQTRSAITFLYRTTRDHRVVRFAQQLGFKCRELEPGKPTSLGDNFEIVTGDVGGDSWLWQKVHGTRVLNVNDCILNSPAVIERVAAECGGADVLMTQFSYANWCSREGEPEKRAAAARDKLEAIALQVRILRPRVVVPFASYVWFAHEENAFMNDHMNRIAHVYDFVRALGVECAVMYPGDRWTLGDPAPAAAALQRYAEQEANLPGREPFKAPSVSREELQKLSGEFVQRLRSQNWLWSLLPLRWGGYLRPVRLHLTDLDWDVSFDMFNGVQPRGTGSPPAEIGLSSDVLAFCLRHEFGFETTLVGGRFDERAAGAHQAFSRHFAIARRNKDGLYWPSMLWVGRSA